MKIIEQASSPVVTGDTRHREYTYDGYVLPEAKV